MDNFVLYPIMLLCMMSLIVSWSLALFVHGTVSVFTACFLEKEAEKAEVHSARWRNAARWAGRPWLRFLSQREKEDLLASYRWGSWWNMSIKTGSDRAGRLTNQTALETEEFTKWGVGGGMWVRVEKWQRQMCIPLKALWQQEAWNQKYQCKKLEILVFEKIMLHFFPQRD